MLHCLQPHGPHAAHQVSLSFTVSWSVHRLMSIESVMLSNHLILSCPLHLLPSIFPSIRIFSNVSAIWIRWPKFWSFSFSTSLSNEYSALISFKIDWHACRPRDSQESSPAPQFESINYLALSLLYGPTLTSVHDYWTKNIALPIPIFVSKVNSLLFNMLSLSYFPSKEQVSFN